MGFLDRLRGRREEKLEDEYSTKGYAERAKEENQRKRQERTQEELALRQKEIEKINEARKIADEERRLVIIRREARAEAERKYAKTPLSKGVQKIARGAFHKKPQQQRGSSVECSKVNARLSQLEARQPQGGGFFGGFGSGQDNQQRQIGTGGWFDQDNNQQKKKKGGSWFDF